MKNCDVTFKKYKHAFKIITQYFSSFITTNYLLSKLMKMYKMYNVHLKKISVRTLKSMKMQVASYIVHNIIMMNHNRQWNTDNCLTDGIAIETYFGTSEFPAYSAKFIPRNSLKRPQEITNFRFCQESVLQQLLQKIFSNNIQVRSLKPIWTNWSL